MECDAAVRIQTARATRAPDRREDSCCPVGECRTRGLPVPHGAWGQGESRALTQAPKSSTRAGRGRQQGWVRTENRSTGTGWFLCSWRPEAPSLKAPAESCCSRSRSGGPETPGGADEGRRKRVSPATGDGAGTALGWGQVLAGDFDRTAEQAGSQGCAGMNGPSLTSAHPRGPWRSVS